MPLDRLPVKPPIEPMLSAIQTAMPKGDGWRYEPKWDGFRTIVFRDGDEVYLQSRDSRPLLRYFPEIEAPLKAALPERCIVDGELVIETPEGLDFGSLQMRLHPAASRVKLLASQTPSSFIAFDLIADGDEDLREHPFAERRARLQKMVGPAGRVRITPQTTDPRVAEEWLLGNEREGFDGVVAKRDDLRYVPGQRIMVKLKRRRTADVVVGGYRLNKTKDGIGSLLLGLFDGDGVLHFVGHTSSFKAPQRRVLLAELQPLVGGSSFGEGRTPGGPSRWSQGKDMTWTALTPTRVCEVSYDHLQKEGPGQFRMRHAARFERWREDKPARACTVDQLEEPGRLDLSKATVAGEEAAE